MRRLLLALPLAAAMPLVMIAPIVKVLANQAANQAPARPARPPAFAPGTALVAALAREADVARALERARALEPEAIADQIRFCETPAPPFEERARGELLRRAFAQIGLQNVRVDREGNVLGDLRGKAARPRIVLAAHLDTVFPPGTAVKVTRSGATLQGPGIGDNCRGLAVLVAVAQAMRQTALVTGGSVTFVANVGEEGLGDLRGVRALFPQGKEQVAAGSEIDAFVSIDGPGLHVTHIAVGSLRYRVTFKGPGGHSFGAFGTPNPISALSRAATKIAELQVPSTPRTTFNVGRIGGGTSVNSIPFEAWMEVDLRSSDAQALAALDQRVQRAIEQGTDEENARWGGAKVITVNKERVGSRPAGSLPADAPIVQTAVAAAKALGFSTSLTEGSTDANLPISLGVPAITIGGGGQGSDAHALTEAFDTTDAWKGTQLALLVTIALTGR